MSDLDIRAERRVWTDSVDVVFFDKRFGDLFLAEPLMFKEHKQWLIAEPTISLKTQEAQLLMDELWRCGLRPTEGTGSAGSLAATENHLKDMQKITMGLLKKYGVKP